jgi:hypothetical protein
LPTSTSGENTPYSDLVTVNLITRKKSQYETTSKPGITIGYPTRLLFIIAYMFQRRSTKDIETSPRGYPLNIPFLPCIKHPLNEVVAAWPTSSSAKATN